MNPFKKIFALSLLVTPMLLGFSQQAHALTFIDLITLNLNVDDQNGGNPANNLANWTHDINDNIGGNNISNVTLSNVVLEIAFSGNQGLGSLWNITGTGLNSNLSNVANGTNTFNLTASSLTDLQTDGFFQVILNELSNGRDQITVISSKLSADYSTKVTPDPNTPHSPEPATFFLLGSGLLAGFARFRKK